MLPEIERLLILQDRDRRTRTLKTELKTIPADRTALEQKLAALKGQANDARQRQRAAEVEQARLDTEIRAKREQIAKYETQKLQTRKNEEYQALNHGIDHVKREISAIEDRQIELMETLEALKPEVAASDKAAAEAEIQVKKQISDLESKNSNLQGQIAELESGRPTYTEGLDEDLLDTYQRLFLTKGEAVVAVRNEVCSGCHMKITVSTSAKVKAQKSVVHCEQCNRILFPEIH
jgi:predicted  nucleic acid-binding Zn-ribbon protein